MFLPNYRPIKKSASVFFLQFWPFTRGKRLQNDGKYGIFQNWLYTRLKMETQESNAHPTILGGVLRGFWTPLVDSSARSLIFRHLKMGTFGKSARFQVPKNGTSSAPI